MSDLYGAADDLESIATVHAALDAGITYFDTADFYGMGHNELLLARAIASAASPVRRDRIELSVKFGALRDPAGNWLGYDCRPVAVKSALAYTLRRLGTDHVDVYRPARLDPAVPVEETVGAIAELVQAGHVRSVGLSCVTADEIRRAHAVHPIADVQMEYSLIARDVEADVLPTCRELGIEVTAYGVLSRGLLSGHWTADRALTGTDVRAHIPRFHGDELAGHLARVERLRAIALEVGASVEQLAIAWVLSRGDDIVPLVGARRRDQLAASLPARDLAQDPHFDASMWARVERAVS